ncbi:hypothetical protein [Enterococcus sp. CSURQ0835]
MLDQEIVGSAIPLITFDAEEKITIVAKMGPTALKNTWM